METQRDETLDFLKQIYIGLHPEDRAYWTDWGMSMLMEAARGPHLSVVSDDSLPPGVTSFRRRSG
jgi:hypothetical protein